MHEKHEEREIREAYQRENAGFRLKSKWVWGLEREESIWEVKRQVSVYREWEKWNLKSRWSYLKKSHLDGSRICRDLSSTNSRQINLLRCYRESVDSKIIYSILPTKLLQFAFLIFPFYFCYNLFSKIRNKIDLNYL